MKMKQVTVRKNMKIGLPSFSNIDVGCDITFELAEDERVDWDTVWDTVNQQMWIQSGGIDPSWITTKEYTNFFKTTIKSRKENK